MQIIRPLSQVITLAKNPLTPYILSVVAGTGLTAVIAIAALSQRQPEILTVDAAIELPREAVIDPAWEGNDHYCVDRPLADCHTQLLLRLNGYRRNISARESARYLAQASTLPANPRSSRCYQQSQQICLGSFANNIYKQLTTAETNQEWLAGLEAAIALGNAQSGIQLPADTAPDRFKILATLETWQNQVAVHFAASEAKARQQIENSPTQQYTETPQESTENGKVKP